MAVEAELRAVGKIGAELQEERPEVPVVTVKIVLVDRRLAVDDPRDGAAGLGANARGAWHPGVLLGDTDENHPFVPAGLFEPTQLLLHHLILALAFLEAHQFQPFARNEGTDLTHEGLRHRHHLLGRGVTVPEITAAKCGDAAFAGELRHVGVEIHPIDAFQFQHDVF